MRSLARQLIALVALFVLVVGGLAGLAQLKFSSFLSDSVQERLEIVATTTAHDFAAATDLGLRLAEVANGPDILDRARSHDPIIRSIVVLNTDGRVLHSVSGVDDDSVSSETLEGFRLARLGITAPVWSVEDDVRVGAGVVIEGAFGQPVGAVVVDYPKSVMSDQERVMAGKLISDAVVIAIAAALAMAVILPAARRRLEPPEVVGGETAEREGTSDRRSRTLLIWVSAVLIAIVGIHGFLILQDFNQSLEPELQRRAALIGATIRDDTVRAVDLGIPLSELVGVEEYLAVFLSEFDELDYLALNTESGDPLFSVGLAESNGEGGVAWRTVGPADRVNSVIHSFEFTSGSGVVGSVDVGVDEGYVRSKLDDLALDVGVILIVAVVVAFEVTLAVSRRVGRSRASGSQAGAPAPSGFPSDIRLVLLLFAIAEELNKSFLPLLIRSADNPTGLATNVTVSLPIVAYLLTMAVASPVAGQMMRSIGERRLFALGVGAAATSHLGMVFAGNVLQIIGLRSLTGIGYALTTIACLDYMLDRLTPGDRARSVAVFVTVVMGGTFAGTALGGIFADRLGYDAVFIISFFMVAAAGLASMGVIPTHKSSDRSDVLSFKLRDTLLVVKKPSLVALLAGVTIPMNVLMAAFLWFLVPLAMADLGSDASAIARTLMIYYLVNLVGGPTLSRVARKRIDLWFLVGAGSVLSALILVVPAISPTKLTISLAVFVVGLGHAAVRGPQIALALDIADAELSAGGKDAALAAMRSLERLGSLAGLLAVAVVASAFDFDAAIGVVGAAATIAGMVFIASSRLRPKISHG